MESDKYFKVVSEFGNVIHIKPQGNWTDEIAEKFGQELKDKFSAAVEHMYERKRKFIVLANMSNFHIEGEKTSLLLTELMKISRNNEYFYRTVQIIPDSTTREEIKASSDNAGQQSIKFVVGSMDEANKKIVEIKKELLK